jgi:hypothetical protein
MAVCEFGRMPVRKINTGAERTSNTIQRGRSMVTTDPWEEVVARRTDVQILVNHLISQESCQASVRRLTILTGWDEDKVRRVVENASTNPMINVHVGRGGTVQYRGTERTSSNGLYSDVARVLATYWASRELNLRNVDVIVTATGGTRGGGVWTHPDLVIAADPARRRSRNEPRRLHAVEVETNAGFDVRSVYQAHAQGRGAEYSWVFGNTLPGVAPKDWERVMWTAESLGVGVVTFDRPGSFGTWTTHRHAEHKEPSSDQREAFLDRVLVARRRTEYEL